jgi:hypothetical protein
VPASLSYPVELRLRGSFLSARDARLAPQLAAGGQSFPLQANPTDQELRFSIPVQLLADASKPGFGYTKATLTVPYETRALLGLRRVRKMATYNLLIGTLPATPGTIKVFHKVVTPDHERQHVRWPARGWLYQDSGDNDIPQDASDGGLKLYQADPPPAGWSIDPATVRFVEGPRREGRTPGGGDWERRWEHRTNIPAVTFGVATIKRTFGHRDSGKMDFAFEYDIVRPAPRESWSEEVVVLKWGDSRVFPYTSGNYRVEFTAFDGTSHQWTGANSNPFLHVADQADSLRLEAQHPRTLIWP